MFLFAGKICSIGSGRSSLRTVIKQRDPDYLAPSCTVCLFFFFFGLLKRMEFLDNLDFKIIPRRLAITVVLLFNYILKLFQKECLHPFPQ